MSEASSSPRRLARLAGMLYLAVAVFGGAPQLWVRPSVRVAGDPAATAEVVAADETLLRVAFVSELIGIVAFLLLVLVLFRLLAHVDQQVAAAMVILVAIAVAVLSVNMMNHLAAVIVATDGALASALGADGSDGLALLFLELHEVGYSIAEIFFGLWLLPLGYLALRSGWFPRPLAVLLMVGCFAYLTLALTVPLFGGLPDAVIWIVAAPAGAAELWMVGYLLTRGVDTSVDTPTVAA